MRFVSFVYFLESTLRKISRVAGISSSRISAGSLRNRLPRPRRARVKIPSFCLSGRSSALTARSRLILRQLSAYKGSLDCKSNSIRALLAADVCSNSFRHSLGCTGMDLPSEDPVLELAVK